MTSNLAHKGYFTMSKRKMPAIDTPFSFSFFASLPPIQSAITFDGNGDGARVKLDLSRAESGAAVLLQQKGAGKLLKVTVEVLEPKKPNALGDDDLESLMIDVAGDLA